MTEITPDLIRALVGAGLSDAEAAALAAWYAELRRGLQAFPAAELGDVEPPLRSTPGPRAS